MDKTPKQKAAAVNTRGRYGYCPVCSRERRYTVNNEMRPHRRWIRSPLPYGSMTDCPGTGKPPLESQEKQEEEETENG